MTGKKTRQAPAQNRQKKRSGNPQIPVWLKKTRQAASVKCERFQMKIGMTGKNMAGACTRLAEKNAPGTPKCRNS